MNIDIWFSRSGHRLNKMERIYIGITGGEQERRKYSGKKSLYSNGTFKGNFGFY